MASSMMFESFRKYILFHSEFNFIISLYFILNEENYIDSLDKDKTKFVLTYAEFKKKLIKLRKYAQNSCSIVCQSDKKCIGHQVLEKMQNYDDFIFDSVERCSTYYKYVKFVKTKNDNDPLFGFEIFPYIEVDLGWKSWSERMSYLIVK